MTSLGLSLQRVAKSAADLVTRWPAELTSRGWFTVIKESFAGAWQRNVQVNATELVTFSTVWACLTLIASDIAKLAVNLTEVDEHGIWNPIQSPAFSPVLRKPNHYQNRIQFFLSWVLSKLTRGNAYVLKERDGKGNIVALYVLDPSLVKPLVAPNGDVFYQCQPDALSGLGDAVTIPASEIIHDVMYALFHPLCGLSPIVACALAATQGIKIQQNSAKFFANGSNPGGILTTPANIGPDAQKTLKDNWDANYGGEENIGKIAVLAGGLEYKPMTVAAKDAQLADQLKMSSEMICSAFHVPAYMVGVGQPPAYNNIEALNQQYYSQCLQILIESLELCLDEGLKVGASRGVEFDLDGLLRMDTATMIKAEADAVGAGIKAPNESRRRLNLRPVKGGDSPYLQQQNYSLGALDRRDSASPAPTSAAPAPSASAAAPEDKSTAPTTEPAVCPQVDITAEFLTALEKEWPSAA